MNIDKYKIKLEEEKNILEEELGGIGKIVNKKTGDWKAVPESQMHSQEVQDGADLSERAEDFEERSSKLDVLEARLTDIKKALEEIESGTYGICKKCGMQIKEERLNANPAAHTCISCI